MKKTPNHCWREHSVHRALRRIAINRMANTDGQSNPVHAGCVCNTVSLLKMAMCARQVYDVRIRPEHERRISPKSINK